MLPLLPLRFALGALSLAAALASAAPAPQKETTPDPFEVLRRVRDAARLDSDLQSNFTYLEERRDVKVSKLGKVTVGPVRTFEVYPARESGATYKRLIAVDGKPLTPAELARRDAEHQQNLRDEADKRREETSSQAAARQAAQQRQRHEREAALEDAVAIYVPTFAGRERLDGERVLLLDLTPRREAHATTRQGRWMKHFAGRAWIDEDDYQIAKLDMHALDDVTIGWGVVGRVHAGSRFMFTRRKFEGAWLPAEVIFEGTGRTLLFRKFQIRTVTTYSGYRRVKAEN